MVCALAVGWAPEPAKIKQMEKIRDDARTMPGIVSPLVFLGARKSEAWSKPIPELLWIGNQDG